MIIEWNCLVGILAWIRSVVLGHAITTVCALKSKVVGLQHEYLELIQAFVNLLEWSSIGIGGNIMSALHHEDLLGIEFLVSTEAFTSREIALLELWELSPTLFH